LWKSAERAADAAESLGITADRLKKLGLVDEIVPEPLGGAHRDPASMMANLKKALQSAYQDLADIPADKLVAMRRERLSGYGTFKQAKA
jgi:acetyl-CoA carboxylase carboxyl transferase subunit alpha